jgi:hypothetical protein
VALLHFSIRQVLIPATLQLPTYIKPLIRDLSWSNVGLQSGSTFTLMITNHSFPRSLHIATVIPRRLRIISEILTADDLRQVLELRVTFDTADHDILPKRQQRNVGLFRSVLCWITSILRDRLSVTGILQLQPFLCMSNPI